MDNKIQSDGAIYTNDFKTGDKQPDWTGKIEISKDLLKQLVAKVKEGEEAEVRVALWDRTSKAGKEYKYARMDIPQQQKPAEPVQPKVEDKDDFEDSIPF
tara:strand:+ start:101 stop:400 length:300 start_codon:yes stop_codon:yes gene_type:complete